MNNFTVIRNGLREHIKAGKFSLDDLGLYLFLHLWADYSTGIYTGCALTIAFQFDDPKLRKQIQQCLYRLRHARYINYRKGDGKRGSYPILIDKYEPTVRQLSGTRLNAWKHGELAQPEYESLNGTPTEDKQKANGYQTVEWPIKDLKTVEDVKDVKTSAMHSVSRELLLPDWLPADSWEGFVEMRKKVWSPLTDRAISLIIGKLEKLRGQGHDPAALLDEAVEKSWKTVYLPKEQTRNGNTNRAQQRQDNALAARDAARAAVMGHRPVNPSRDCSV